MAASSNIPQASFYSSPMKLFVVALLSSLKNLDNSTSKLVFRPLMHQPRVYSGAPGGVHVTTVHAYDPEKPRNKVEYNLPNVLDYKNFFLNKTSGDLTTALTINKTIGETYQVMVTAVSYGASELEHLQIAVTEFNHFSPKFQKRHYNLEFHPKTKVGSVVLKVKATDPDNTEIYYILDQNQTSQYFNLDCLTGELSLKQPINDTNFLKRFGIYAEDGGSPKRWDYVPVNIIIKHLSEVQNVTITNITFESATVCWEASMYGEAEGYVLTYVPSGSETHYFINVTSHDSSENCIVLNNMNDNIDYKLQIHGWNQEERGQKTPFYEFHTAENWCNKMSCNDGLCIPLNDKPWYECDCLYGYYGTSCEYFDPCSQNPCDNNGKCLNTTHNEYVCICAEDYSGPNCKSYNPCLRRLNPCENGGTCEMTTRRNTYVCICPEGFYGHKCKYRDYCTSNRCLNGATCNMTLETEFLCICSPGFIGDFCDVDIDECASSPCLYGSTCVNLVGSFKCICPPGFTGLNCENPVQCPGDRTDTTSGVYYWNATNHSTVVTVKCPFSSLDSAFNGLASRACILENEKAFWGPVNGSLCKGKDFVVADEIADQLNSITNDPNSLNFESLEAVAQGIETISKYSTQDRKLAEGLVKVISNVMKSNDSMMVKDENNTFNSFSQSARQMINNFASNVELKPGSPIIVASPNVRIHTMEWVQDIESDHLELRAPASIIYNRTTEETRHIHSSASPVNNTATKPTQKPPPMVQVFVPKEALQEAHRHTEGNVRVKFVIFYNDKLFQSKQKYRRSENESTSNNNQSQKQEIKVPVFEISVGNVTFKNLNQPLIYVVPLRTVRKATCVYWDERVNEWSRAGLTTNHTETSVICQSSHMTAFSVLLDMTPARRTSDTHNAILSILSYCGSSLSIIGLSLTLFTYKMFGCLNRDHPGKILSNLCLSLLFMNMSFMGLAIEPKTGGNLCAIVGLALHYFVLSSLAWMCVEAVNMYQLLVHVFASSETHFLLKRCLFAWGFPLIIVTSTASFKARTYYEDLNCCMISPKDPIVYYAAFLGPCCLILAANFAVFLLVSRVIFTPRLTASKEHSLVTVAQIRGAFTVMVLLGVTWIFGTMAIGKMKLFFQYFFCLSNSLQGFLIFLVRCLLYPEARNAWIYLIKTGKLKRYRGIIPPGTVSFSNSQTGHPNDLPLNESRCGRILLDEGSKISSCATVENTLNHYQATKNASNFQKQENNNLRRTTISGSFQNDTRESQSDRLNQIACKRYHNFKKVSISEQLSLQSINSQEVKYKNKLKTQKNGNENSELSKTSYDKFSVVFSKNEITANEDFLDKDKKFNFQ